MTAPVLAVTSFRPLVDGGSGYSWGEAWWTAADMTLTHPRSPMQQDLRMLAVPDAIADAYNHRMFSEFLFGPQGA